MIDELQIRKLFIEFLKSKGYPEDSFALEYNFNAKLPYRADLIIFDAFQKQFLCLIEFKNKISDKILITSLQQVNKYKELIGVLDLPTYLVGGDDNQDFIIYQLTENGFQKIERDEFPSFQELSNRIYARERFKEIETKIKNEEKKTKNQKSRAWASLSAILVALIGGIISIFLSTKLTEYDNSDSKKKDVIVLIDSLENQIKKNTQKNTLVLTNYQNISLLLDSIKVDSTQYSKVLSLKINKLKSDFGILESENKEIKYELSLLKKILSDNPMRVVELNNLKTDIVLLDKDYKNDIKLVQKDLNTLNDKYNFIIGGLITIIASILILALPNLFQWGKK